jgi:hypothetical protein
MSLLNIPFDEYCALPGVNWSTLGYMRFSPLHYTYDIGKPARDMIAEAIAAEERVS